MTPEHVSIATSIYLGLAVGGLLFAWAWEDGAPLRRWADAAARRRHIARNLALLATVIVFSDYLVAQQVLRIPERLFDPPAGLLTPLQLPGAALVVIAFVVVDFYEYAFHRLLHAWRPLWLLHAVHHADPHVDFSTSARHHPVETAVVIAGRLGIYLALGLPLWIEVPRVILTNTVLLLQHTNTAFPRWIEALRPLFVTPAVHKVHHGSDPHLTDRNYGQIFSVWDRMLGTYAEPVGDAPPSYGLRKLAGDRWQTLAGMLGTPLTARRLPGPL
jgi:sterol desaturase/sphingolipid hydroxylase (fatty acid hydroxylase superfamily)